MGAARGEHLDLSSLPGSNSLQVLTKALSPAPLPKRTSSISSVLIKWMMLSSPMSRQIFPPWCRLVPWEVLHCKISLLIIHTKLTLQRLRVMRSYRSSLGYSTTLHHLDPRCRYLPYEWRQARTSIRRTFHCRLRHWPNHCCRSCLSFRDRSQVC